MPTPDQRNDRTTRRPDGRMVPAIRIDLLADHRDWIQRLSGWHFAAWGGFFPQWTASWLAWELSTSARRDGRPISWVAVAGDQPIGTVSLFDDDIPGYRDHGPWIANVYVDAPWRRHGIGRRLMDHAMAAAHAQGVERCHLFTHDQITWYEHLGWERVARPTCFGKTVQVMARATGFVCGQ